MYDEGSYLTEENFDDGLYSEGIPASVEDDDPWPAEDDYDD